MVSQPFLITLFTLIDGIAQGIYGTLFNLMLRKTGVPTHLVGRITSVSLWGAAIFGLIFGLLADKYDKKKLIIFTQLASTFFSVYRVLTTSYIRLILTSFFFGGMASATGIILSTLLVMKTGKDDRGKFLGLNFGVGMFTGVIGNVWGGVLGDILPVRFVLVVSSLCRIFALVPLQKLNVSFNLSDERIDVKESLSTFSPKSSKIVFYYILSTMSVGFGAGLFVSFGNVIFYDLFKMNATKIGIILALAQLATSVGAVFSHKLGNKFGDMNILIFSYVVVPILIVALSFVREPVIFTSVYVLRFAVMNMVSPLLSALVFSNIPHNKLSSVNGINNFVNNVSRALSAEMFAFLTIYRNGYTLIFVISSLFYFVNAFVMIRMYKHI
ncbi:MAG: MFS transporter [Fervidobacterium sp.]